MKQLLRLICGIIPFLLFSCDYSPSGAHFEEVNPNPEVIANITLHPDQDTLRLRGNVNLHFSIQLQGRAFYEYRLMIDDKLLASGQTFEGKHQLNTKRYDNGYFRLRLYIVGNSGTGSLADKSGAESIEIYRDWVVYIDNTPPQPIAITKIEPEDGQLKLEWQQYKGTGFVRYDIIRKLGYYYESVAASITDPGQTSWIDPDYVGGQASYAIALHVNGNEQPIRGTAVPVHYPQPRVLSSAYNDANELSVTISSTPFYRSFGRYELSINLENVISTGWKDTVLTIVSPDFGGDLEAFVHTYSNSANPLPTVGTNATIPGYGTPWGPHAVQTLFARPSSGYFYASTPEYLKVIDASTLQVKHERNIRYKQSYYTEGRQNVVSADGRYMYAILENTIHQLDPLTLQTIATFAFSDLLPADYNHLGTFYGCSNDNRLLIRARSGKTYQDQAFVVDMAQKRLLLQKEMVNYNDVAAISPDGKIVRVAGEVFLEGSNGKWQKQLIPAYEAITLKFHPTKPLFYTTNGQIHFYSTANGMKQKTMRTEAEHFESEIEAGSEYLYAVQDYTLYVYNIDTGQLRRKLRLDYSTEVFVYNNRIYSQDRYIAL